MAYDGVRDPLRAMEMFKSEVDPYDPDTSTSMASIEVTFGQVTRVFQLSSRATNAFARLLMDYVDPENCGLCPACGGRLDRHFHCPGCDRVGGVFGQVLAHRVAGRASGEPV